MELIYNNNFGHKHFDATHFFHIKNLALKVDVLLI